MGQDFCMASFCVMTFRKFLKETMHPEINLITETMPVMIRSLLTKDKKFSNEIDCRSGPQSS